MRKWYLPLTVMGVGGLGLLFLSDRGRDALRRVLETMEAAPEALRGWNESAEREIARLQNAVNDLAHNLGAV